MSALLLPELPAATPQALQAAVRAVIDAQPPDPSGTGGPKTLGGRLPQRERLLGDAEAYHEALLEAVYAVAAADGLADDEREALSTLVSSALDRTEKELESMFTSFGESLSRDGLQVMLGNVAGRLKSFEAREEVLTFAALIAVSDRELGVAEADALLELGSHFGFGTNEVQNVVDEVAERLTRRLQEQSA